MIWVRSPGVLLQSEWPWQPSDTNTFFLFIFVFLCTRSFFKEKTSPTCFVLSARTAKLLFFIFSFMVHASLATILMYLNSTDEGPGPKRLEIEHTNITRRHFCSLSFFYIEHSFIYFFLSQFFPLFICFDILWRLVTTHATGTQIVRAKWRHLMRFFAGETSRALALSLSRSLFPQKTQKIYRSRKIWARRVGKSNN